MQVTQAVHCGSCIAPVVDVTERLKAAFFRAIRLIPAVNNKIKSEVQKTTDSIRKDLCHRYEGEPLHLSMPENGLSEEEVLEVGGRMPSGRRIGPC